MSIRRSIFVLVLLVLLIPVIAFSVRANRLENQADTSVQQLQTYTVGRGEVEVTVTALGSIEADQTARLSFTTAGRVTDVYFQAGDYVLAGDVLARVQSDSQRIAVEQAQAALDLALIQRDQLLEGPDEGQIAIAQANIDAAEAAVYAVQNAVSPQDIQAAELQYQAAQQALTDAIQARTTAGGRSEAEYALLDAQVGEATFNAETARLQLENLRSGTQGQTGAAYARLQQAERELERLQVGASQVELDRADAQIAQAELNLEQAQTALARTALTAPFDGYIQAFNIEVGGIAAPGLPAVELTDVEPLNLTISVDEIDVRQIREGMPARVRLDALPDEEFPAVLERIALISTNEDGLVSYDVQVQLDQVDDPRVRVGMTAEAAVVVEARDGVIVVPNLYIRLDRTTNTAFVNVLNAAGQLEEIEVTLGLQGPDASEILAGLREGDVVAVDLAGDSLSLFGG
ncbi:MAG: efflux RND transporter periplasmic adaptor subunit [bacterium]|nr:efflux RND transporter periplasmic adaptor subunit [bacterium]